MELVGKDAVVLCAGGTQCLRHRLLAHGAIPDGEAWLKVGAQRIALVAEVEEDTPALPHADTQNLLQEWRDIVDDSDDSSDDDFRPGIGKGNGKGQGKGQGKGPGKGQGKGQGKAAAESDDLPLYTVEVPLELVGTELIVVYDGAVQACASLSKVICSIRCPGTDLQVLHLAGYERSVFVQTHEERLEIEKQLGEDLRLCSDLELAGQQRVPKAATLVSTASSSNARACLMDAELPTVFDFRLRQASLGLVMRLRQRFGCCIPEVFYDPLCAILTQGNSEALK
jgi:hypothetical protein